MHDCSRRSTYLPMSPAHLDHLPICLSSSADLRPCSQTASCKRLSFNMLTLLSAQRHSIVHSFLQHCSLIVASNFIHSSSRGITVCVLCAAAVHSASLIKHSSQRYHALCLILYQMSDPNGLTFDQNQSLYCHKSFAVLEAESSWLGLSRHDASGGSLVAQTAVVAEQG